MMNCLRSVVDRQSSSEGSKESKKREKRINESQESEGDACTLEAALQFFLPAFFHVKEETQRPLP
jgi:hypothetical protein